ncbi:MAG TPA: hypothetical protein VD929_08370 [Caulobacteraceae bacterium]|nr:hypothetical protein [Caulobacteraceae bacterium]
MNLVTAMKDSVRGAPARMSGVSTRAGALARESALRTRTGAGRVAAQAKRRPVSSGALLLGAVAGGALLLNPALRRMALANAPLIWSALRRRTGV